MIFTKRYSFILLAFVLTALAACKDRWEDHAKLHDTVLKENLMQPIEGNPDLSRFAEYLKKTGYNELLVSSKLFTVWAPTNEALANMDQAVVNDVEKLKQFVANHISYQQYYSYSPNPSIRIQAINGKYLTWDRVPSTIEEASVVEADKQYKNGVLHVINKAMSPKMNSWEYLNSLPVGLRQKNFINAQSFNFFDPLQAEQIGVDPATGAPIYKPGTGVIWRNTYLERVRDIMHEDSLNTFIVLTDEAFDQEFNKLNRFYKTSTEDSTNQLTSWNLVKDLAFKGLYTRDNLPDTLTSLFNVKVPVDKNAIVSSYRTSNGIVHVMNKVDFRIEDKMQPIVIEGESAVRPADFSSSQVNSRIHYRFRPNASGNHDLRVYDHGTNNGFWVRYRIPGLPAGTYRFYMKAVKDFGTADLTQRLAIGDRTQTTTFPNIVIPMNHEEEVFLGEHSVDSFGALTMYVVSNSVSGADLNPIVVDYIKLVPVL
ncbi:fasciclin domain-containing protein [Pontibacter beigongshangensis]|uniref:fasciclin domain-containing protein n=1 Tax=Pontibacter beigongshangensis TaxID=2574733 RepID=UPI00164F8986|nr:fasciclin domain-containing protein [Pontibacter beigongshangensis]